MTWPRWDSFQLLGDCFSFSDSLYVCLFAGDTRFQEKMTYLEKSLECRLGLSGDLDGLSCILPIIDEGCIIIDNLLIGKLAPCIEQGIGSVFNLKI